MAIPKKGNDGATRHPNRNGRGKLRAAFGLAVSCLLVGGTLVATAGNASAAPVGPSFTVTHICTPGAPNPAEFQVSGSGWTPNADVTVGFNVQTPAVNGSGNGATDSSGNFSLTATEGALMAYPGNGAINATFEVLTSVGGVTKQDVTQKLTVAAINCVAPTASFTSSSTGLTASFDASGTTGTGPLTYAWDFGDGSTGTSAAVSHTYTKAGTYTVKLTVKGPAGTNTVTHQVTVSSPTPPPVTCKTSDVVVVSHNADDTDVMVKLRAGVASCDVSLNGYGTDGPTWPTSGTQVFLGHTTVHLTASSPQGELKVQAPACDQYGQTDLYVGTKKYDGTDGALPHYPNVLTPPNLVAHWNGKEAACPTPPPAVKVTPTAPKFTDVCGTANDSYTIPSVEGVEYKVNGVVTAPGTYQASGKVTIVAIAKDGYVLAKGATSEWCFTFTNVACPTPPPVVKVTPTAPMFTDVCDTANDTYTIPSVEGVEYKVNGTVEAAGTYPGSGSVTVTADALKGYVLADGATTSWTFTFTNAPCYTPPPAPTPTTPTVVHAGTGGSSPLVPLGVALFALGAILLVATAPRFLRELRS